MSRWPTPGSARLIGMPSSLKWPSGPIPDLIKWAGEWMAPDDKIISFPLNSCGLPSTKAFTPIHFSFSKSSSVTTVLVEIVRFFRFLISGVKYPMAADTLFSSKFEIVTGKKPSSK